MSNTYKGKAGNISVPAQLSIVSSTNTAPIGIQTSTPHGLTTGDTVDVFGHQTNTAANGQRTVTIINSTTFTLDGSTGVGTGGATGKVNVLAYAATLTEPSDGDAAVSASVDTPLSGLADRTSALVVSTGKFKIADFVFNPRLPAYTSGNPGAGTVWASVSSAVSLLGPPTIQIPNSGNPLLPSVQIGDVARIDFFLNVAGNTTAKTYGAILFVSNVAPGAAASWVSVPGTGPTWVQDTALNPRDMHFRGTFVCTATGTLDVGVGFVTTISTDTVKVYDDASVSIELWRPTFVNVQ